MINVTDYIDIAEKVRVTFIDGAYTDGHIESIDDEEESEIGEPGISFWTDDGVYLEIGQSEIDKIEILR